MTTLEQIKAAARMGYSAKLKHKDKFLVVGLEGESGIILRNEEELFKSWVTKSEGKLELKDELEITGFLYVGHLFGKPEIPEGQRFRVKELNQIGKFKGLVGVGVGTDLWLSFEGDFKLTRTIFNKSELEPIFNQ